MLGQLGVSWDEISITTQAAAEDRLLRRLGLERDPEVRREIIAALGRVGRNGYALRDELVRSGPEAQKLAGRSCICIAGA